ncbi:hypothetical protein Trydic_g22935 [Trypoxylus dichotomus]
MPQFYVLVALGLLCLGRGNSKPILWKEDDVIVVNYTTPEQEMELFDFDLKLASPLKMSQIRYMANIFVGDNHACSGAYIRPFWILTSASCISDYFEKDYVVYMGSSTLYGTDGQSRTVQKVISHKKFSEYPERNNIGLIKLSKPFNLGPTIAMIEVSSNIGDNRNCSLIGWGLTVLALQVERQLVLEQVLVELMDGDYCQLNFEAYEHPADIDDSMICVETEFLHEFCLADVGTTLVCGGMLIGITSAYVRCLQSIPIIVFKVSHFSSWIEQKIAEYSILEDEFDNNNRINGQLTLPLLFTFLNKAFFQYR